MWASPWVAQPSPSEAVGRPQPTLARHNTGREYSQAGTRHGALCTPRLELNKQSKNINLKSATFPRIL